MAFSGARALGIAALMLSASALAACDDEPDSFGEAVEDAGDQLEEDADRLGDAIDDAARD